MESSTFIAKMKGLGLRILRLAGAFALIYACMVFYLALTERQIAFPRAIPHKEANEAIKGKAHGISCTLEDGTILEGWSYGSANAPTALYYPDSDEDGAQFLAEAAPFENVTAVTFNYRGSGNNKGTPSNENFESDAQQIAACAAQVNNQIPAFIIGRGVGAILAAQQFTKSTGKNSHLILIDPVYSIADQIHEKYRLLYPKFLIRADVSMPKTLASGSTENIVILQDRKSNESSTAVVRNELSISNYEEADGSSLHNKLANLIQRIIIKAD